MVSPFTAKQRIEAPRATDPRYGLLFTATELKLDTDWPHGVKWAPEQTGGGGVVGVNCRGGTDEMVLSSPLPANPGITTSDPFVVWAEDHCTAMPSGRDFVGRATRQLEATQSYRIAHELWTGTLATADTLDNDWLMNDPKVLTAAAVSPMEALALIEIGLGQMLAGRRGMVHVSPQVLTELITNESVVLNGQLWMTAMGNIVVSDAGYPGTKPTGAAGSNQWIYGTPLVGYALGPIDVPPMTSGGQIVQNMNRAINDIVLYASREAILIWDWKIPAGTKHGKVAAETSTAAFAAL